MKRTTILITSIAIIAIGLGFWKYNGTSSPIQDMPSANVKENVIGETPVLDSGVTTPAQETKEFSITGKNFSFSPATITVAKGDKVRIVFKNTGGFHDFRIDEFKVATDRVADGGEDEVEFIADKAGTFEYYCSVGTHRQMGMKGVLTVTE